MAKQTTKKEVEQPKHSFKTTIENLPFHNFEVANTLICIYENRINLGQKDGKPYDAIIVQDYETKERKFIPTDYSIIKHFDMVKAQSESSGIPFNNYISQIEFVEKTMVKGKPFKVYICGYLTEEEYNS